MQPVDPHLWCPFDDGTALTLWDDPARTAASVAEVAPGDVDGYLAYEALFGRIRRALRGDYTDANDTWLGPAPTRAELEERLGHDPELVEILFHTPIADVIERHVTDERLRTALHGQGIIGTFAGPRDPGTAAVHAMHSLGTLDGKPGAWGYVEGGMGRVSLALADAATEAGAVILTGVPVAAILPGTTEGGPAVALEGGETIRAGRWSAMPTPSGRWRCARRVAAICRRVRRLRRQGRRLAQREPGHQDQLRAVAACRRSRPPPGRATTARRPTGPWSPSRPAPTPPRRPARRPGGGSRRRRGASCTSRPPTTAASPRPAPTP